MKKSWVISLNLVLDATRTLEYGSLVVNNCVVAQPDGLVE